MSNVKTDSTPLGLKYSRINHWWSLLCVYDGAREAMVGMSVNVPFSEGSGGTKLPCRGERRVMQ